LSKKNISNFFNHPNILVKKYKNISELTEIFVNQDAIIYTSGPNSADCKNDYLVQKYIKETDDIIKILAENKTVEKFLFLSSIRVISDDCEGLITEESVCNPTSNYGRVKNTIEKNLLNLNKIDGLNRIILRITNGYGFPAHKLSDCWSLVVMDICKQAVINKKIELRSDGQVYKDFIPINTITDTIENIITDENLKPVEIFNVSSGISVKVIDLIYKIEGKRQITSINSDLTMIQNYIKPINNFDINLHRDFSMNGFEGSISLSGRNLKNISQELNGVSIYDRRFILNINIGYR